MKKRRLSCDEWKCILSKKLTGISVQNNLLTGYIGFIDIEDVTEPQVWNFNGENIVFCNNGMKWLSILPQNDYYCITAMLNDNAEIIIWYIDMIASQGIDKDGIPYFDDLYLDLVVYPNGNIIEDDMDELVEALKAKDIDKEQFQLAIDTSKRLKSSLLSNVDSFIEYTYACYQMINSNSYDLVWK